MAARVDYTVARDLDQVQRIVTSRREGRRRLDKLERLKSAGATWRDVVGGKQEVRRYGERFLLVYEGGCEWLDRYVEVSCLFQVEFSCFVGWMPFLHLDSASLNRAERSDNWALHVLRHYADIRGYGACSTRYRWHSSIRSHLSIFLFVTSPSSNRLTMECMFYFLFLPFCRFLFAGPAYFSRFCLHARHVIFSA